MRHCDLTLPTPEENLACDEALLEYCEAADTELLRFWEPADYFVVVGYANRVATEVNLRFCQQNGIPVLRRCTGGGTVLQGPGCLNYSLILRSDSCGPLSTIGSTNEFILQRHQEALLGLLGGPVDRDGQTDLARGSLKFSGNAQRRRRDVLLFHGSFLLQFDLTMIEEALPLPSRQPPYRANRSHKDFLVNLKLPAGQVKAALIDCWSAAEPFRAAPRERIRALVRERYARSEWNFRF